MPQSKDMEDTEDTVPLKKCLGDDLVSEFVFVARTAQDGKAIFEYRHTHTRRHIYVDEDGKTYQAIRQPGAAEPFFERITKAEAKEHVLRKT